MDNVIEFPMNELAPHERRQMEEFIQEELADIQDTTCESVDEIKDEVMIFFGYVRQFMDVFEDPKTKINPDFDFGLALMEGRIRKIQGMLQSLFEDSEV